MSEMISPRKSGVVGTDVRSAANPHEALALAGLDWRTEAAPLTGLFGDDPSVAARKPVTSHVCNYRSDNPNQLGVVSDGFQAIQNSDMADFAQTLIEAGDGVVLESAAPLKGGRKVFMMLAGESFSVGRGDVSQCYFMLANAHDGSMSFRAIPTTRRLVCQNQLHSMMSSKAEFTIRHTSSALDRVAQARQTIAHYERAQVELLESIQTLASRDVTREQVQEFWLESYQRDFGGIPVQPKDDKEQAKRDRALDAVNKMADRFDRERDVAGATAWNAFNAYSGWVQHDRRTRSADRTEVNLFGASARMTSKAFSKALTELAV